MDVDIDHQRIVVATSGRRICFLDLRQGKCELVLNRESSLKYQTRDLRFFPSGNGIALGSVEGNLLPRIVFRLVDKPYSSTDLMSCFLTCVRGSTMQQAELGLNS